MLRFSWILFFSAPFTFAGVGMGGAWVLLGPLAIVLFMVAVDALHPHDRSELPEDRSAFYNLFLYCQLPISAGALLLLAWRSSTGDLLGIGAALQAMVGDLVEPNPFSWTENIGAAIAIGFLLSVNVVVGHELIHRTHSPAALVVGRWLLAMMGDSQFSISHVHEHHLLVGTEQDPATARRGESLYRFFWRSSLGQFRGARNIEARRLLNSGQRVWSWHNRFLRGQAMTLCILLAFCIAGGWRAGVMFVLYALYAKFLYETVNYIQHFGLVRLPDTPVEAHHSWDCTSHASSTFLFNLTRHASHHLRGELPYWQTRPSPRSVSHRHGYTGAMILAIVPSLWRRYSVPRLLYWDTHLASDGERARAQRLAERNFVSGASRKTTE